MSTTSPERAPRPTQAPVIDPRERERLERAFRTPRTRFVIGVAAAAVVLVWSFIGAQFYFA